MVSLRELNQRSGRIVRLVAETGRAVTITDHGRQSHACFRVFISHGSAAAGPVFT